MRIISIKGTNMPLTDAIKSRVMSQAVTLEKLTSAFEPAAELSVEVGKSTRHHTKGPFFVAEFNLTIPGSTLRAKTEEEDLYHAIMVVRDQLRRQLKDVKSKMTDKHERGGRPDKA